MKNFYPIRAIDSRFQIDYTTPLFEEHQTAPEHTSLYVILIKHKEIKTVSDGKKILELNLFE